MRTGLIRAILAFALIRGGVHPAEGITVTINTDSTFQTIEGFGGCAWSCGSKHNWNDIVKDLDATVVRIRAHTDFNGQQAPTYNEVKGLKIDYPVRFVASFWSPPANMKVNGSMSGKGLDDICRDAAECPNTLKESAIPDFARYCADYVKRVKAQTGVDLYGFSFQNESAFNEPYSSCVYTADKYVRTLKAVSAEFKRQQLTPLLFGAEDMARSAASTQITGYAHEMKDDPAAIEALDRFAVHGYSTGVAAEDVKMGYIVWHRVGAAATHYLGGKPVWQTETSGFETNWDGALALGISIMQALKYAHISMWTFWTFTNCSGSDDVFEIMDRTKTKRYYVSKNYYRYIRPEAVMVSCNSEEEAARVRSPGVMTAAFVHPKQKTMSIVLINTTTSNQPIQFAGTPLPSSMLRYETSSSRNCQSMGTVDPARGLSFPAKSVTTLLAEDVTVGTGRPVPAFRRAASATGERTVGFYALDGRAIDEETGGVSYRESVSGKPALIVNCRSGRNR